MFGKAGLNWLRRLLLSWMVTQMCAAGHAMTIHDIQYTTDASGNSLYNGQIVSTGGIVTGVNYSGQPIRYFVADRGGGLWSGILVNDNQLRNLVVGDSVRFQAEVQESNSQTRLRNIVTGTFNSVAASGVVLPLVVFSGSANSEAAEGVLVEIQQARVTAVAADQFTVDDGSGPIAVGHGWTYGYSPVVSDTISVLRGIVTSAANVFTLNPRSDDDIAFSGNRPPLISGVQNVPASPTNLQTDTVTATITDEESVQSAFVHYRFGDAGDFSDRVMYDDGLHGDGASADGLWGGIVPAGPPRVTCHYYISATDAEGATGTSPADAPATTYNYIIRPSFLSIFDLQYTGNPTGGASPYAGQTVTVTGIVTGTEFSPFRDGFFISDPGGGLWSGIEVYNPQSTPALGDSIRITGIIAEYNDLTEFAGGAQVTVQGRGTIPEPLSMRITQLADSGEPFEGTLARIDAPMVVTDISDWSPYRQFNIRSGSVTAVTLGDFTFEYVPALGDSFTWMIGCITYNASVGWMIAPRSDADIGYVDLRPPQLLNARAVSQYELNVYADERLSSEGIGSPVHYTIINLSDSGFPQLTVQSASLFSDARTLHLSVVQELLENHAYRLSIDTLRDLAGNALINGTVNFQGYAEEQFVPIADLYDQFNTYSGLPVTIRGVVNYVLDVTTTSGSRRIAAYIQDNSGRGLYLSQSGPASAFPGIRRRNQITIRGIIGSYAGTIQLNSFTSLGIAVLNEGVPLPDPLVLSTGDRTGQHDVIQTSTASLHGSGTWCKTTGTINRVDEHIGGATDIFINDGSGDLIIRVWDALHLDSVFLNNHYYRLGNELVGVSCGISGPAENNNGSFLMLVGYAEDFGALATTESHSSRSSDAFSLAQNYPNPFNPSTAIVYSLPRAGHVSLRVFDLLGREVAVLKDGMMEAGTHRVTFNGSNLASGVYFARLDAGEFTQTKKLMLLK